MKAQVILLALALALALAPPATLAQGPVRAPGDPTFEPAEGPIVIADTPVRTGDRVASWPVRPARTGILVGDAKANRRLVLPDGAPVFGAPFAETLNGLPLAAGAVWCGVPPGAPKGWCLLDVGHGLDVLVGMSTIFNPTPYAPDSYSTVQGRIDAPLPTVREQPASFPVALREELTFRGWTRDGARFSARISDDQGRRSFGIAFTWPREADGSVVLPLRDGALRLRPGPDGARVEQSTPAGPPPTTADHR